MRSVTEIASCRHGYGVLLVIALVGLLACPVGAQTTIVQGQTGTISATIPTQSQVQTATGYGTWSFEFSPHTGTYLATANPTGTSPKTVAYTTGTGNSFIITWSGNLPANTITLYVPNSLGAGSYQLYLETQGNIQYDRIYYFNVTNAGGTTTSGTTTSGTTGSTTSGTTTAGTTTSGTTGSTTSGTTTSGTTTSGTTTSGTFTPCWETAAGCAPGISTYNPGSTSVTGVTGNSFNPPGDLGIGIPGLGSISLPTGWWTAMIDAALSAAGDTGPQLQTSMTNAQETADAHDHLTGDYMVAGFNSDLQNNNLTGDFIEAGFQRQLTGVSQAMFEPDPASIAAVKAALANLIEWGPITLATQLVSVLATAAPGAYTVNGAVVAIPQVGVYTSSGITIGGGVSSHGMGEWYDTGNTVPLPFDAVTHTPLWTFFRALEGGFVFAAFGFGFVRRFMPLIVIS